MYSHHTRTIQNVKDYFLRNPEVQALLLSRSLAQAFTRIRRFHARLGAWPWYCAESLMRILLAGVRSSCSAS